VVHPFGILPFSNDLTLIIDPIGEGLRRSRHFETSKRSVGSPHKTIRVDEGGVGIANGVAKIVDVTRQGVGQAVDVEHFGEDAILIQKAFHREVFSPFPTRPGAGIVDAS